MRGFTQWIKTQTWRQDFVGDLAKDISNDPDFPRSVPDFETLAEYVYKKTKDETVLHAAQRAWNQFAVLNAKDWGDYKEWLADTRGGQIKPGYTGRVAKH